MTKRYRSHRWGLSGLQRTLLLYVVLPMLVLSGLAIGFGLERASELEDERLRGDLELIGRAIRLPVADALMQGDIQAVRANLDSVFSIGRVYGASVYDTQGILVAAAGIVERDLSESILAEQVVRTGEQQDSYREVAGRDVFSQFLPINDRGGRIIGLLQITRRAQDFEQSFAQLSRIAWGAWLAVAIATVAILVFGHYGAVGRHIEALVTSMRRVAQGDRGHRAVEQGPGELREVAGGLNRMLDSIEAAEQEIEARREHEQKLNYQLRESEKLAAIGQVASGVAHELGAPLTVIDGRARRLQQAHPDDESQRQLAAIRGQVQRLTKMVRQLLAFSRTPVTAWQQLSVHDLIRQAQLSTSYEFEPDGPAVTAKLPAESAVISGDPQRLELALVNLLRNALQVAKQQVVVEVQHQELHVDIIITDDGPGIPADADQDELVKPFKTTKAQGEGTGLGLAIVAHIIADHQGEFSFRPAPEGGCQAQVRLPRQVTAEDIGL